ncbi:hypothetical protein niasHS_000953 [Heterodera schachtii]|uniref:Proteasome subunit beta n=1 Tax=Heterodera schachtii TaxID=97005 RepID=A0ABD2K8B9_HETSC
MAHFMLGIRTDNWVILAADTTHFLSGAIKISESHQKEYKLGPLTSMVCFGEAGDVDSFANWAKANCDLYSRRNGYELRPKEVHHWLRKNMADNLRSEDMWRVNAIIGGFDSTDNKAYLTMIDYLATNIPPQNFIFYGFPGAFAYSIMDSFYRPDLTEQEGLELVQRMIDQVKRRAMMDLAEYRVVVINSKSSRTIAGLKPKAA